MADLSSLLGVAVGAALGTGSTLLFTLRAEGRTGGALETQLHTQLLTAQRVLGERPTNPAAWASALQIPAWDQGQDLVGRFDQDRGRQIGLTVGLLRQLVPILRPDGSGGSELVTPDPERVEAAEGELVKALTYLDKRKRRWQRLHGVRKWGAIVVLGSLLALLVGATLADRADRLTADFASDELRSSEGDGALVNCRDAAGQLHWTCTIVTANEHGRSRQQDTLDVYGDADRQCIFARLVGRSSEGSATTNATETALKHELRSWTGCRHAKASGVPPSDLATPNTPERQTRNDATELRRMRREIRLLRRQQRQILELAEDFFAWAHK